MTMSVQAQASSSALGEPPSAMSTDSAGISDEETVIPNSSQMELVDLPAKTHNLRQNKDNRLDYKECSNSDSETSNTTDEASAESEYNPPPSTVSGVTTRSRAKKETKSFEKTAQSSADRPNATKRSIEAYQSETTRPSKRGRPTATDITIQKFTTQACAWMETFASNARELENTRSENQELKRQIKRLDSALKQEQENRLQNETVQNEDIHQLENECKRLRNELLSALDEIKKDAGKYVKVTDPDIQQKWAKLSYNIQQMVSQYLSEYPIQQNDMLHSLLIQLDRPMLEFDHEYTMLRNHILRRTIWHFLMIGIFEGEYAIWHGNSGRTLTKFLAVQNELHLEDTQHLKTISEIKSRAIAELGGEIQLNEEAIEELTSKATMAVVSWIPNPTEVSALEATEEAIQDPIAKFQAMFKGLIAEAACLHTIMMKSKAIFLLQWFGDAHGSYRPLYNQEQMDACQYGLPANSSLCEVNFVEAPGLMKIGNADGEDFHLSMVLCKSSVILGEQLMDEPLDMVSSSSSSEDDSKDSSEGWLSSYFYSQERGERGENKDA